MNIPDIVIIGLSLSSSWGNGHATTFRALIRGLAARGRNVLFLERDSAWYAEHRDLPEPDFCTLSFYASAEDLRARFGAVVAGAPAVIVGSYVPDGVEILDWVLAQARGTVGFYDIDTPVTLAALERRDCAYIAARQIPALDLYLSFAAGPTLDRLAHRYGARRPVAFYCAVDAERYRPAARPMRWDLGYLGTYSPDRQPALTRLLIEPARRLPQLRFAVAGPQYPDCIDWPDNVERIAHLPPSEHADFYRSQRFTLNVTRADMIEAGWSPSVRLFEAAACGTPIISDRWPGLTSLLPENEAILIADDTQDVVRALGSTNQAAARARAARAGAIVRAGHTGLARAQDLEAQLDAVARHASAAQAIAVGSG